MKRVSTYTLALGLVCGVAMPAIVAPAVAQEAGDAGDAVEEFNPRNLSEAVRTSAATAQTALEGETVDIAAVRTELDTARAAIANDDDRYIIGRLYIQLAGKMQAAGAANEDIQAMQAQGVQLALDSQRTPIELRAAYWAVLGNLANRAEDFAGAIPAYEQAIHYSTTNPDVHIQLALAYFRTGNPTSGYEQARTALRTLREAGTEVPQSWFLVPLNAAYEARDAARTMEFGQELLSEHPEATNWNDVLRRYQYSAQLDDSGNLDLLRLMHAAGALDGPSYAEYVQLTQRGLPGEARTVYAEGVASGNLAAQSTIQSEINRDATADEAALAAQRTEARAAATGRQAFNAGDAFASYGQYDTAIEMYQLAREKGGVDADALNLHLATALLAANRGDEARQAFAAVNGPRGGLAHLWLVWLDSQAGGQADVADSAE